MHPVEIRVAANPKQTRLLHRDFDELRPDIPWFAGEYPQLAEELIALGRSSRRTWVYRMATNKSWPAGRSKSGKIRSGGRRQPLDRKRSDLEVVGSLGIGKDPIWRFVGSLRIGKDPIWRSSAASGSEKIRFGGRRQPRNRKRSDSGVHSQEEQCFRGSTKVLESAKQDVNIAPEEITYDHEVGEQSFGNTAELRSTYSDATLPSVELHQSAAIALNVVK